MVLKIYAFEENWKASINVHTKPLKDGFCPGPYLPFEQKNNEKERQKQCYLYINIQQKQTANKKNTHDINPSQDWQ